MSIIPLVALVRRLTSTVLGSPQSGGTMTQPAPYQNQPENGIGSTAVVFGAMSVVLCCIPILSAVFGVVALITGNIGVKRAIAGRATNKTVAQWGFWLGFTGLIISVIVFAIVLSIYVMREDLQNTY